MPVPFLLAGLGLAAGAIGAGAHFDAKETNERAQRISEEAQELYDDAKRSLEYSQKKTESSLLDLGYAKKTVLESSMQQFLQAYERIKNIELSESVGLEEISNFTIDQQEALQLREMSEIYQSAFSSAATGAATGAVIALASSGSLPVVTGVLSTAGTALMAGEVGMAAGLAGSALSFGAAMTPLAAIAAPTLLFTGISSSIKADENLEKARTIYAEAEAAVEKMRISETLCVAISDRCEMFNSLLVELNSMFSECTSLLDGMTRSKIGLFKGKRVDATKLTHEELKLIAVTRSLAGAVKAVIDTPILNENGSLSSEAEDIYENTVNKLPDFTKAVEEIDSHNYKVKPISANYNKKSRGGAESSPGMLDMIRNAFAIVFATIVTKASYSYINEPFVLSSMIFTVITLAVMNNNTKSNIFKSVKHIACVALAAEFSILLYFCCKVLAQTKPSILLYIIFAIVSLILFGMILPKKGKKIGSLRSVLQRLFACIFLFAIALLLFIILAVWIELPFIVAIIITEAIFTPFALVGAYSCEL
ncbi:hypothetical protein [Romboutsia lituseburensis]|uniref:hypothetical protein n=1 Tax=Romboutsia lituseburensis TaxID=1537 RepID=UPI00215B0C33|nr:hypothetical protein [Romboutsia lituseburensis]MCR8744293.1 hypothetical protein [Romboutsia lituseburensis]